MTTSQDQYIMHLQWSIGTTGSLTGSAVVFIAELHIQLKWQLLFRHQYIIIIIVKAMVDWLTNFCNHWLGKYGYSFVIALHLYDTTVTVEMNRIDIICCLHICYGTNFYGYGVQHVIAYCLYLFARKLFCCKYICVKYFIHDLLPYDS